jgi:hypothetical protein
MSRCNVSDSCNSRGRSGRGLQKSTRFLQELLRVPLDFDFIFYKHGPYSFDLADEVTVMRADQLLTLQHRDPYGPSLLPSTGAEAVMSRFPVTRQRYDQAIEFVASRLGRKNVADLEQLATALYVTLDEKNQMSISDPPAIIIGARASSLRLRISSPPVRCRLTRVNRRPRSFSRQRHQKVRSLPPPVQQDINRAAMPFQHLPGDRQAHAAAALLP